MGIEDVHHRCGIADGEQLTAVGAERRLERAPGLTLERNAVDHLICRGIDNDQHRLFEIDSDYALSVRRYGDALDAVGRRHSRRQLTGFHIEHADKRFVVLVSDVDFAPVGKERNPVARALGVNRLADRDVFFGSMTSTW